MTTGVDTAILWLGEPGCDDPAHVGGKAAHISRLVDVNRVPPGFCVLGDASDCELDTAYRTLSDQIGVADPAVAVRSSAADEDGATASFAGQHETVLNVSGIDEVWSAIARCRASASSDRVSEYRRQRGLGQAGNDMPVLVQQFIVADASAVAFSINPVTGDRNEMLINASWGIGEAVVSGAVTPDSFTVRRNDLSILERRIADKRRMTVAVSGGTEEVDVPAFLRERSSLSDDQLTELAHLTLALERTMGWPVDIECAWASGELYLLQCRPVTTIGANS